MITSKFKIWRTIKLGLHKSSEEYRRVLRGRKYRIRYYHADQFFDKIPISQEAIEVDLVLATSRELGLEGYAHFDVICNCALENGLQRCPSEVGPALREQYPDQPKNDWLPIAMEPILIPDDPYGRRGIFCMERDVSIFWLSSGLIFSNNFFDSDRLLVFRFLRK
ncbi:MAG: hypothetical protein HYV47_01520 [Candidatus Nealsonbacteria bacterium]|nr:hypothetical protein [Candidatus Nealsonbacteria bacterium]